MGKSSEKSSSGVSGHRAGYQVGVFKDGRLKKIMKMKEGSAYLRQKTKKLKEDHVKRECSSKQLEALAKGRAIREKNRAELGAKAKPVKTRVTSVKNQHRIKDSKAQGHRKKNEKARVRREKELETGKHRSGGDGAYDSDSANSSNGSGEESN